LRTDSGDIHVESARIQEQIEQHLGLNGAQLLFEYNQVDGQVKLDLITVNPRHSQSFLFHSVAGFSRVDALQKMLDYVQSYRDKTSSFTIQWMARGDRELQTSYFRASNVYDALDKLYYGRDINTITVFSVVLNPIA
jgi:predicted ATP-grasp superfamily ATP-dependent carboligase